MEKKKTNIKERVLQIAKKEGYSYQSFFDLVGLSYSNFKGIQKESSLGSDAIDKILSNFPDIDLHWLITGEEKKWQVVEEEKEEYRKDYKLLYYEVLEENRILNNENRSLRKKIDSIKKEGCKTTCKS